MPSKIVPCPHCGEPVEWSTASRWRPFCSERCKMIDLGAWASETYRIRNADPPEPETREPWSGGEPASRKDA